MFILGRHRYHIKQATSLRFCSVKHESEKPFQPENPQFTTCNEASKQFATNLQTPQEVNENDEIFFTYDVKFQVKVLTTHTDTHIENWITTNKIWHHHTGMCVEHLKP